MMLPWIPKKHHLPTVNAVIPIVLIGSMLTKLVACYSTSCTFLYDTACVVIDIARESVANCFICRKLLTEIPAFQGNFVTHHERVVLENKAPFSLKGFIFNLKILAILENFHKN